MILGSDAVVTSPAPAALIVAFGNPTQFTFGNSGRNILRGDSLRNLDFAMYKSFFMGVTKQLVLNHTVGCGLSSLPSHGPVFHNRRYSFGQNRYFNPNCSVRPSAAVVTLPKFGLVSVPLGAPRFTSLKKLKKSVRN